MIRAFAVAFALVAVTAPLAAGQDGGLPSDFFQVLPRGRIASIDAPHFVTAAAADLPDDAWVFGVSLDGEARAYSLNLLNRHEVVNDRTHARAFAAVW